MNTKTPYFVLHSKFHASWASGKDDGRNYSFDSSIGLLVRAYEIFLDEWKLKVKQQSYLSKGKV